MSDRPAPPRLELLLLRHRFAIARLAPDAAVPRWAAAPSALSAVVRTGDELSLLTMEVHLPAELAAERGWRTLKVRGPLPFHLLGIMAALAQPLADARVSILPLSTFDTDYLLVKERDLPTALEALRGAGHTIVEEPEPIRAGDHAPTPHVGS